MHDRKEILRRQPGDPLLRHLEAHGPATKTAIPLSTQGLCPELQALFAMTMISSNKPLPFPLLPGAIGVVDVEAPRDASEGGRSARRRSSLAVNEGGLDVLEGGDQQFDDQQDFGGGGDFDGGFEAGAENGAGGAFDVASVVMDTGVGDDYAHGGGGDIFDEDAASEALFDEWKNKYSGPEGGEEDGLYGGYLAAYTMNDAGGLVERVPSVKYYLDQQKKC